MDNKKQLHLKTINFEQVNRTPTRLTYQSFVKTKRSSSQIRPFIIEKKPIRPHNKSKRFSTQMLPPNQDLVNRFTDIQLNRQSLRSFANTSTSNFRQSGQFPKRQPLLKNTNAFKYFLNSTINKMPPSQNNFLDQFYQKISHAIFEQQATKSKRAQKQKRTMTQTGDKTSYSKRPMRSQLISSKDFKRKVKTSQMKLQPWETPNAQENTLSFGDF